MDTLNPEQAAELLGCSARTVRRAIFKGHLAGDIDPYRTTREAIDAFRQRQQGLSGEVLAAMDTPAGQMSIDVRALMEPLAAELASARQQIERLSFEVGRLHAELEQARAARSGPATPRRMPQAASLGRQAKRSPGPRAQRSGAQWSRAGASPEGRRAMLRGTLARLGRWLLR